MCDKCGKIESKASVVNEQARKSGKQNTPFDEPVFRSFVESLPTLVSGWARSDLVKQRVEGITKDNECLSHMEPVTEYLKSEAKISRILTRRKIYLAQGF